MGGLYTEIRKTKEANWREMSRNSESRKEEGDTDSTMSKHV